MLIIIEGPDRTGKTTLADVLGEYGAEVAHAGIPEAHPLQEYVLSLEGRLIFNEVFDRWHLGQAVYPKLNPEREPLKNYERIWIELFLRSRGATLTWVQHTSDEVGARVKEDPDSYLKEDQVAQCVRLFKDAIETSLLPKHSVRFGSQPSVTSLIATAWQMWAKGIHTHLEYPLAIGNVYRPRLLLVGDMVGRPNPPEATHLVPFAPYPGASGKLLMKAIELWDPWRLRNLAIINSRKPSNVAETLDKFWEMTNRPNVVALGNEADYWVTRYGVPHGSVPHPQYIRRFHHKQLREYSQAILRVAETGEHVTGKDFDALYS